MAVLFGSAELAFFDLLLVVNSLLESVSVTGRTRLLSVLRMLSDVSAPAR